MMTVRADCNAGEDIVKALRRWRCPRNHAAADIFKGFLRDQRLVGIFDDNPVIPPLSHRLLDLERNLFRLSLNGVPKIYAVRQHFTDHRGIPAFALCLRFDVDVRAQIATVHRRCQDVLGVEAVGDVFRRRAILRHPEHPPDNGSGLLVDYQLILIVRCLLISVGRKTRHIFAALHFDLKGAANFAADVAGVQFVHRHQERRAHGNAVG